MPTARSPSRWRRGSSTSTRARRRSRDDGRAARRRRAGGALADEALDRAEHALDEVRRRRASSPTSCITPSCATPSSRAGATAIRERLETEWRKPLDELLAGVRRRSSWTTTTLRDEAEQLRAQLDALGVVNPLAIEEHEEETKRLDFLTAQRDDLAEAKSSLQQAIREIDATARELFLATFAQVRENFRQIFMTLFGGGECDLRLENPDAPLDCDIEIHASPRGKRTQRIHLLSSGERALVALSLLFGIFLTKPSPFCLLDEVDAPLDDAEHRPLRAHAQPVQEQDAVHRHHAQPAHDDRSGRRGLRRDDAGAGRLVARERAHARVGGARRARSCWAIRANRWRRRREIVDGARSLRSSDSPRSWPRRCRFIELRVPAVPQRSWTRAGRRSRCSIRTSRIPFRRADSRVTCIWFDLA